LAVEVVEQYLAECAAKPGAPRMAIMSVERHQLGWLAMSQGEQYIRTRNCSDMLIGARPRDAQYIEAVLAGIAIPEHVSVLLPAPPVRLAGHSTLTGPNPEPSAWVTPSPPHGWEVRTG